MKRKKRKCRNCGRQFIPDNYNHYHQYYCSETECRRASRKASKAKHNRKQSLNLEFRRKENERVKQYQKNNPDYWKKYKKSRKKDIAAEVLRDLAQVGNKAEDIRVLRDFAISHNTVINGLISYMTGEVLRDNIGAVIKRLYDRGREVSGTVMPER